MPKDYVDDATQEQLKHFLSDILALKKLIEENQFDLSSIPGMRSTLDTQLLIEILQRIIEDLSIYDQLLNLEPGAEPLKIKKNNRDTLTFRVFRTPAGQYKLALSIKRNRIDLSKRKMDFESGFDKERKITLVFPETKPLYAELLVDFTTDRERKFILDEIRMHNLLMLNKGFAPLLYAGTDINPNTGKKTIVLLAPFKPTLEDLLSKNWLPDGYDPDDVDQNKKITAELILQLLEIVQVMHSEKVDRGSRNNVVGIEHKDLKPSNFLVDISQQGVPILQVTDFNTMKSFGDAEELLGTISYMPPWLIMAILTKIELPNSQKINCMGKTVSEVEKILEESGKDLILSCYGWHVIKQHFGDKPLVTPGFIEIQGKHDMWSAACIILRMKGYNLKDPLEVDAVIAQDEVLNNIFKYDPDDIPNIDDVMQSYLDSEYYRSSESLPEVKIRPIGAQNLEKDWLDKPSTLIDFILLKTTRRDHVAEHLALLYGSRPFDKVNLFVSKSRQTKLGLALRKIINGNPSYALLEKNQRIIAENRKKLIIDFNNDYPTSTDAEWGKFKKNEILFDMVEYLIVKKKLAFLNKQQQINSKPRLFFPAKEPHYEFSPEAIRTKIDQLELDLNRLQAKIDKYGPAIKEALSTRSFDKLYGLR